MKKFKKFLEILFTISIFVLCILMVLYQVNKEKELDSTREELEKVEEGTTYYYSEEEIQKFIEASSEIMIKEVEEYDLNPGENRFQRMVWDTLDDMGKHVWGDITKENYPSKVEHPDMKKTFAVHTTEVCAEELFNTNLSLKDPYLFYGYTGVSEPSLEYVRAKNSLNSEFKGMVYALKYWDNKYKDSSSNELVDEIIDYSIEHQIADRLIENPTPKEDAVAEELYILSKFNDSVKENSMNRLQQFYQMTYLWNIKSVFSWLTRSYSIDKQPALTYNPFPAEFNYWEADEINYFTEYYPTSVTKFQENIYIVNIETVKPINRYAAVNIATTITTRFKQGEIKSLNDKPLQVVISVNDSIYHGMERSIYTWEIIHNQKLLTGNGDPAEFSSSLRGLDLIFGWAPSVEARPWVDRYFEIASEAYESDSRFSIFETIELVSEEFDVDYNDVESVIMTVYWIYNNMIPY